MSPVEFYISCTRKRGHIGIRISIRYSRTNRKGKVTELLGIEEPEQAYRSTMSSCVYIKGHIHTLTYFKVGRHLYRQVSRIYRTGQLDVANILLSRELKCRHCR